MSARTKKTQALVRSAAVSHRRGGRPRTATAGSRIYSDLRNELVSLQRRPGEVISEAEIALSYGVSRTPVREAILKLADEGLLEIFPQSGIFVLRISVAALRMMMASGKAAIGMRHTKMADRGHIASRPSADNFRCCSRTGVRLYPC